MYALIRHYNFLTACKCIYYRLYLFRIPYFEVNMYEIKKKFFILIYWIYFRCADSISNLIRFYQFVFKRISIGVTFQDFYLISKGILLLLGSLSKYLQIDWGNLSACYNQDHFVLQIKSFLLQDTFLIRIYNIFPSARTFFCPVIHSKRLQFFCATQKVFTVQYNFLAE